MYRIEGVNSIRGFNEERILTPKFSIFNLECWHNKGPGSKFYTISDFGLLENNLDRST
jgi:hypothetical protein